MRAGTGPQRMRAGDRKDLGRSRWSLNGLRQMHFSSKANSLLTSTLWINTLWDPPKLRHSRMKP